MPAAWGSLKGSDVIDGTRDLATLPKAHLHVHLFGSIRLSTVEDLARRSGMDDAAVKALVADIQSVDSIKTFLVQCHRVQDFIKAPEDIDRICREFIEDEAAAGVVHTEPSFMPHDAARTLGMTPERLFRRMDSVFRATARKYGMTAGYVMAPNRARNASYLKEAAKFAVRMRRYGVVAFGYGGDESWGHERMVEAVDIARAGGLRIDPHAGETAGPKSVSDALRLTHADRLAHGTTAIKDAKLISKLVRLQIPCDIAVVSNVHLGVAATVISHPLRRMVEAGVAVTLNADDTTFFAKSVLEEYELARKVAGLSDRQLATIARNSLNAAYMPEPTRQNALNGVARWLRGRGVSAPSGQRQIA